MDRKEGPMRTMLGNCLPVGGFCTAVSDIFCEAVHRAYDKGFWDGATIAKSKKDGQNGLYPDDALVKAEDDLK